MRADQNRTTISAYPSVGGGIGDVGVRANDNIPGANFPTLHEAVADVGIFFGESAGRVRRIAAKDDQRCVGWVGKRAAQGEFAAFGCVACVREMLLAKRQATFHESIHHVIEERVVAHGCLPARGGPAEK